jgi:hypothetical protein
VFHVVPAVHAGFFFALVLSADVCGGLSVPPIAHAAYPDDVANPISFRLLVKPGGPAFRITVRSLLRDDSRYPVHAGDIEVARCSDGRRLQLLPIMAWQPLNFGGSFGVSDINFDGYLDFSVLGEFGATYGKESWWVYEPASGRFVQNELARELSQLGHNGFQIDSEKHTIELENPLLAGCPPLIIRYRVEDNHLIKVHEEMGRQITEAELLRGDLPAEVSCIITVSDLVAGTMRVTQVRQSDGLH